MYFHDLNVPCKAGITEKKITCVIMNEKKYMSSISEQSSIKDIIDLSRTSKGKFLNLICHFFTVVLRKRNLR